MKFFKYILALVLIAGTFAACDTTQDPAVYKGPEYIRFTSSSDQVTAYIQNDGDVYQIPVGVTTKSSTDRTYTFEVVTEETTASANDYSISSTTVTIPADSVIGIIPITVNKSNLDGSEVLTLKLTAPETAEFGTTKITLRLQEFCPYDQAALVGTYTYVTDAAFDQEGNTLEVLAGAAENELILVEPFETGKNITVVLDYADPNNFSASVAMQAAWTHNSYGEARVETLSPGSFSQCDRSITLNLEHTVDAGSFGELLLVIQKQ